MIETYLLVGIGILVLAVVVTELLVPLGRDRERCSRDRLFLNRGVAEWCCGHCKE